MLIGCGIARRFAVLLLWFILPSLVSAQSDSIRLGMSTALSGPNQYLGQNMRDGMLRYFAEINDRGGIDGKLIELVVMDDSYVPKQAVLNTEHLIHRENVLAIVGNVGTPTATEVIPVISREGVVFFGAFTGADILRSGKDNEYVINYRASYRQEMRVTAEHIEASAISPRRIAFLLQDDLYGVSGFEAAVAALSEIGFFNAGELKVTGEQEQKSKPCTINIQPECLVYEGDLTVTTYQTNSLETEEAIGQIIDAPYLPEAIIIVGAYQPSANFIRFMHGLLPSTNFYNLSFAGAGALARALAGLDRRIYMTQVVPPSHAAAMNDLPQDDSKTFDQDCGTATSLPVDLVMREGYLAACLLVRALEFIDGEITRESLKEQLRKMAVVKAGMDGSRAIDNQVSNFVALTRLDKDGTWEEVVVDEETTH